MIFKGHRTGDVDAGVQESDRDAMFGRLDVADSRQQNFRAARQCPPRLKQQRRRFDFVFIAEILYQNSREKIKKVKFS